MSRERSSTCPDCHWLGWSPSAATRRACHITPLSRTAPHPALRSSHTHTPPHSPHNWRPTHPYHDPPATQPTSANLTLPLVRHTTSSPLHSLSPSLVAAASRTSPSAACPPRRRCWATTRRTRPHPATWRTPYKSHCTTAATSEQRKAAAISTTTAPRVATSHCPSWVWLVVSRTGPADSAMIACLGWMAC